MSLFECHPHHAATTDALVVGVGVKGHQSSHNTNLQPSHDSLRSTDYFSGMTDKPAPPVTLVLAFWGWVLTAAVRLFGAVVAIITRQGVVDALNAANVPTSAQPQPMPEDKIQLAANLIVGANVAVSVVFAGLFVLFAWKLRAGRNWARILLIFAALVDLVLFVQSGDFSLISVFSAVIAVATIVLSYLPASTQYIADVRAQRNG